MFKQNVGIWDRMARLVVATVLLSMLFVVEGSVRWTGLVGVVPLATGLLGTCPIYTALGLTTCPLRGAKA